MDGIGITIKNGGNEMYKIKDIDDYKSKLTSEQAESLIQHCNEFNIYPEICAWYDDMEDFYQDWIYDNNIFETEEEAYDRYEYGTEKGEFLKFRDGQIIRLSV